MTCTCTWTALLGGPDDGYLARRHSACPLHGDGTPWWERTQAKAAALGARIVEASCPVHGRLEPTDPLPDCPRCRAVVGAGR